MQHFYAGIGSRETPNNILEEMRIIGYGLAKKYDWILRSGHAPGADSAFELGCDQAHGTKEIYLPWNKFNNAKEGIVVTPYAESTALAKKFHPAWNRLDQWGQKLMIRNGYQVFGSKLDTPVDFVICWTKDGKASGGTGQAIRMAEAYGIPVLNLRNVDFKQACAWLHARVA